MKKILIVAANPKGTVQLRLTEEIREIENGLERAKKRDQFELKKREAVRPIDLRRAILDENPHIVHFSGHGEGTGGLVFEDELGQARLVNGEALAELFRLFKDSVECVVLNGCYSEIQAKAIAHHIDYVVGMTQAVGDRAAIDFSIAFYDALGAGRSYTFAYEYACTAIHLEGSAGAQRKLVPLNATDNALEMKNQEYLIPVLLKRSEQLQPGAGMIQELSRVEQAGRSKIQQIEGRLAQAEQKLQPSLASQIQEVLKWLTNRQGHAQKASEYVFKTRSEMRELSKDAQERFCWEIEKYIEIVYYSLLAGNLELIESPPFTPFLDEPAAYKDAFDKIKASIPPRISREVIEQTGMCFDYLHKVIFS